jgi:hypothetical protein
VRFNATQANTFDQWTEVETIQSTLAEVVWFAVENPGYTEDPPVTDPSANHFFGEPGMRTIYRRTLLIAPWLNPYRYVDKNGVVTDTFSYNGGTFKAQPGLLRILPDGKQLALEDAIACLIAFQDRYDISARLEWDGSIQRWKIMANTLADLTKRENRFCHFGYSYGASAANPPKRVYPFPLVSFGRDYSGGTQQVFFAFDPEAGGPSTPPKATAYTQSLGAIAGMVVTYAIDQSQQSQNLTAAAQSKVRPFAYLRAANSHPATAQVVLNDDGQVVRVVHGPVPLWGERRGEDVQMTNVLAFDLRVYDPGAPIFATTKVNTSVSPKVLEPDVVLTPSDPGWLDAYMHQDNMGSGAIGTNASDNASNGATYLYLGQGAYVDMGYGYNARYTPPAYPGPPGLPAPVYAASFSSSTPSWFFEPRGLSDVYGTLLAPGFAVYDTWSFHYENNGVNDDESWFDGTNWKAVSTHPTQAWRSVIDQATDGLDNSAALGVDDVGERETTPPYDHPLRGMQALIRTYEHDSRAIRQVRVTQHFMQE